MFALPTLKDLMERSRQSFRANLPGSDAWVWPNNVYATAKVIAGMTFEVFGFASYISRQKFAVTAPDIESLRLHGEEFGIPQKPAAPASGPVKVTSAGPLDVAPGAVFQRSDGAQFRAVIGGSLPGPGALIFDVMADKDGKAGNVVGGAPLEIVSGVVDKAGGAVAVVDTGGITQGADLEDIESYRARILFRKRNPPHGGSASDYVMWASEVPGVTRVFVERLWAGPGTVRIFVLMDDLYADGIPSGADIARVDAYIQMMKPAGAMVTVAAPTAVAVPVTISGLSPSTTDVQESVRNELAAAFRRLSRVAGTDSAVGRMPFLASPATFSRSWIWQAIANATGEERHILAAPTADVSLAAGEIATLSTVTFS